MASPVYVWHGSAQDDGDAKWNSSTIAYLLLELALVDVDANGTIYVASEHSQTVVASLNLGSTNGTFANPITIISVDKDNSDAYLAMRDDSAPGKIETTGNNNHINIINSDIYIGLTLNAGDNLNFTTTNARYRLFDCKFVVNDSVAISNVSNDGDQYWENCHYEQVTQGGILASNTIRFTWRGGSFSFNGGVVTTSPFALSTGRGGVIDVSGVDFQDLNADDYLIAANDTAWDVRIRRCKIPAGIGGLISGTPVGTAFQAKFHSVSNSDIIYQLQENYYEGQVNEDVVTYLDATYDGTNGYSIKMVSSANAIEWTRPLRFKLAEVWAGANPTMTVELNTDNVVLQDDEFWIEIEYPDGTTGALGGLDLTSRSATIVTSPTNLTTSTAAWTESFGTEKPQSIEVTIANGQEGVHTVWACLGKPSTTVHVCPKIVVV
jgi:hypothetical protein